MTTLGDGSLGLTQVSPGQQTFLADINANFEHLNTINAWRRAGVSGELLIPGDLVGMDDDGKYYKADHAAAPGGGEYRWNVIGMCATLTTGADEAIVVIVRGPVYFSSHGNPLGAPVYLSDTTPGLLTTSSLSGRLIGFVEDADHYFLDCPRSWATT